MPLPLLIGTLSSACLYANGDAYIWAHCLYLGTPSSMACLNPRLSLLCLLSFPFQLFLISRPLKSLCFPLLITQTKPNHSGSIVTKPLTLYLIPRHHQHLFFSFILFLISFSSRLVPELVTCWVSTKKVHNWHHVTMSQGPSSPLFTKAQIL